MGDMRETPGSRGRSTWAEGALGELHDAARLVPDATLDALADEILAAGRISCTANGRELLMLRAFAMRLMHLGLDVHVAGDVTAKPLGPGDLLLVVCGPGKLATMDAMLAVGKAAGARTLVVTAQPDGETSRRADAVVHLPAQTMADDGAGSDSVLPMGTLFEWLELVFFDAVAIRLRERTGQTLETIRARHTNLE
jgi:6-phospho-3-hexuloisomerase